MTRLTVVALSIFFACGLDSPHSCAVGSEPDLAWSPRPWRFEPAQDVRYIDFDSGDDRASGNKEHPWKHHPWDKRAKSRAATCQGIHTYCFRKGVAYRGTLIARDSGTAEQPIRLTVDPTWGSGEAALYGSLRIDNDWKRCTASTARDIRKSSRQETWYVDIQGSFQPQLLCEVRNNDIQRIPIARTPNWKVTEPDDPRSGWWELTGRIVEIKVYLDNVQGFRVGDPVTGTGRWDDFDENKDNIAQGRNIVTQVADDFIQIDSKAWKKGELKPGAAITNGRVLAKITRLSSTWENFGRLVDHKHLTSPDPNAFVGATLWVEGSNMPLPIPRKVLSYHPKDHAIRVWTGSVESGPDTYCRYFLEGLPQFFDSPVLDSPGQWCYVRQNKNSGRLYLRLPNDRDPNRSEIEVAREPILIDIKNQSHIEISGLALRFTNPVDPKWPSRPPLGRPRAAAIHLEGKCSYIDIHHCRIADVGYAITGLPEEDGDVLDQIRITDNDIYDVDGSGIYFSAKHHWLLVSKAITRLVHFKILRNRLRNIGSRVIEPKARGRDAIALHNVEMAEVAGNIVDRSWGVGVIVFGGSDYQSNPIDRPLIRNLVHHNKVTNSLLSLQDFGGIASWQIGPAYVYNNISGNAVGYKHVHWRRFQEGQWKLGKTRSKNWHRRSCYGVGVYLDGQYKGYVFNNIIWGKNNHVNDRIYNSCAFNEAQGFMNTVFNNTFANCGVGLHKGMLQHNRCYYLGNLMLDIGNYFIRQETTDEFLEYDSLAFARNVFQGTPFQFGRIGRRDTDENTFATLPDWQRALAARGAMVPQTGTKVNGPQVDDAKQFDFRPRPGTTGIDHGAKVFVPWSLYAVVGEWGFFRHRADPSVILGENLNMNAEWKSRSMFHQIPRNNLAGHGINASHFKFGTLDNWIEGALELNGTDQYCDISDAELRRNYHWQDGRERTQGTFPGNQRVTVDMDTNSFLIEVVFKTKPDITGGGIVSKCDRAGYILDIAENGSARMTLDFATNAVTRTSDIPVNDGRWHHLIAEIGRNQSQGIRIYIDGKLHNGPWSGKMNSTDSISNMANFTVGRATGRAANASRTYFAGQLDFLRVARGTLADAETTIDELYRWEFDGPFLRDFYGHLPTGAGRDAGAVEAVGP